MFAYSGYVYGSGVGSLSHWILYPFLAVLGIVNLFCIYILLIFIYYTYIKRV